MNANRMCSTLTTLAAAALFCCAPAVIAQTGAGDAGSNPQQSSGTTAAGQNSSANGSGTMSNTGTQNGGAGSMGGMSGQGDMAKGTKDKMFLKKAASGNMAEIKTAQLALQKSSNDQVKQFAQKMIDDHTKLSDQAKPVMEQMGVQPPSEPMPKEQAMYSKLQGMSGTDFDKAYAKDMVKDHEEDLKEFKKEASSGQDSQVKNLAQQGEPIIQNHLDMAKQLASSVGAMGGSKGGSNSSGSGSMNQ